MAALECQIEIFVLKDVVLGRVDLLMLRFTSKHTHTQNVFNSRWISSSTNDELWRCDKLSSACKFVHTGSQTWKRKKIRLFYGLVSKFTFSWQTLNFSRSLFNNMIMKMFDFWSRRINILVKPYFYFYKKNLYLKNWNSFLKVSFCC